MSRTRKAIAAAVSALGLMLTMAATAPGLESGTWAQPVTVSAAGADAEAPQVALSHDGTRATAVWHRGGTGLRRVQTASATVTGNSAQWSAPVDLSPPDLEGIDAKVAVSDDGTRATAVWYYDKDGTYWVVQAASATIAGNVATWGAPVELSVTGGNATMPDVGLSADGTRATVVWSRFNGASNIVQSVSGVVSGTTATWGSPTSLTLGGSDALYPQVALSQDGSKATAVWYRGIMSGNIQSASAAVTGTNATWSGPVDVSATGTTVDPAVDASADGTRAVAMWRRWNGSSWAVESAAAAITGNTPNWGSPVEMADVGYSPQVALSADGGSATAIWQGADATFEVETASGTVTGTSVSWGATARLSDRGMTASSPQLAGSTDGRQVTAVWIESDGAKNRVRTSSGAVAGNSATWGPAVPVSAAGQDAGAAQLGVSANGRRATAVWRRSDGTHRLVQSASAIIRQSQTVDFAPLADVPLGGGPLLLQASASSGLPVTFSSGTPQACTVDGDRAQLVAVGTCTINADQAGDDTYAPAATTARSFSITTPVLKTQKPKKRCHIPPKKLRRSGKTVLMRKPCRTDAGQKVTVKVKSKPRYKKSGAYKVLRQKKAVKMRTVGKPLRVRVVWKARATTGYSAYRLVKPYRVR